MSRFDYVKYDHKANEDSNLFKASFSVLERYLEEKISDGRSKSLALTKLEEAFMWTGKAIRDDLIKREKCEVPLES